MSGGYRDRSHGHSTVYICDGRCFETDIFESRYVRWFFYQRIYGFCGRCIFILKELDAAGVHKMGTECFDQSITRSNADATSKLQTMKLSKKAVLSPVQSKRTVIAHKNKSLQSA